MNLYLEEEHLVNGLLDNQRRNESGLPGQVTTLPPHPISYISHLDPYNLYLFHAILSSSLGDLKHLVDQLTE